MYRSNHGQQYEGWYEITDPVVSKMATALLFNPLRARFPVLLNIKSLAIARIEFQSVPSSLNEFVISCFQSRVSLRENNSRSSRIVVWTLSRLILTF